MSRDRAGLICLLIVLGAGWGLTVPLSKIAVNHGDRAFGIIFWQLVIGAAVLGAITRARGRGLPRHRAALRLYLFMALVGTILPNAASLGAAVHLPAGVMAIVLSMVPICAFPIALMLGTDRFSALRLAGLGFGLAGVLMLIGPPGALPDRGMLMFVPLALIAPVFYGLEGNVVAKWGMAGLDPVQLLCGAAILGAVLSAPLALGLGQWIDPRPPWGVADAAVLASSLINAVIYSGYVWLVTRAGAVFAAQVAYLVTGFGILWSMVLLDEHYSAWVWGALAVMFVGLFLVQPRRNSGLVRQPPVANDGA